jgi:hypothetical protein
VTKESLSPEVLLSCTNLKRLLASNLLERFVSGLSLVSDGDEDDDGDDGGGGGGDDDDDNGEDEEDKAKSPPPGQASNPSSKSSPIQLSKRLSSNAM